MRDPLMGLPFPLDPKDKSIRPLPQEEPQVYHGHVRMINTSMCDLRTHVEKATTSGWTNREKDTLRSIATRIQDLVARLIQGEAISDDLYLVEKQMHGIRYNASYGGRDVMQLAVINWMSSILQALALDRK